MLDVLVPMSTKFEAVKRYTEGFEAARGLIYAKEPSVAAYNAFTQAHCEWPHPYDVDQKLTCSLRIRMSLWLFYTLFTQSAPRAMRPNPDAEPIPTRLYGELLALELAKFIGAHGLELKKKRAKKLGKCLFDLSGWLTGFGMSLSELLDFNFARQAEGEPPLKPLDDIIVATAKALKSRRIAKATADNVLLQPAKDMIRRLNTERCLLPFGYMKRYTFEASEFDLCVGFTRISKPRAEIWLARVKQEPNLAEPFTVQTEVAQTCEEPEAAPAEAETVAAE